MSPACLMDAQRVALLRRRLRARLRGAPSGGLLSITLDLGAGDEHWLDVDLERPLALWWAAPRGDQNGAACADHRLALGSAISFSSAGRARFAALQEAFSGLVPAWVHDDPQETGIVAAAHLGFAFAEETFDSFPNARLVVPAILFRCQGGGRTVTFTCPVEAGEGALGFWLEALRGAGRRTPGAPPAHWVRQPSVLGEQAFISRVRAAVADIDRRRLDKVVITRSVRWLSESAVAPASVIGLLTRQYPECTIFGVGERRQSFVGATPERLFALHSGTVEADALAGTAWLGSVAGEPSSPDLWGNKNRREHQLVADTVRATLASTGASLEPPLMPTSMRLGQLRHLQTRICGRLREGTGVFDLLAALHPTPAIGGVPGDQARHWLLAQGDRRPAWYTGGIGWVDRNGDGEVVVALRCALLRGCEAELFAGAGIVAGSDPTQELAETEAKLTMMVAALRGTSAHSCRQVVRSASG